MYDNVDKTLNEAALEWSPKGHPKVPMRRKAFPLDDDSKPNKVVTAKYKADYSDDDGEVVEAVKSLDPYLYPRDQILLRTLIKLNSIKRDIYTLKRLHKDASVNQVNVKPLTIREGIEIARRMSPYLPESTYRQVNNVVSKMDTIEKLNRSLVKIKTTDSPEIKLEYILDSLKYFIPYKKYNQLKQIVNVYKIIQTSSELSKEDSEEDVESSSEQGAVEKSAEIEGEKDSQFDDIMNILDKINKKNRDTEH